MTTNQYGLDPVLAIDFDQEVERITQRMREILSQDLHRRGFVIAMSGGIDSSVCAALAVKALGPKKVFGLLMPEKDSSSTSGDLGKLLAEHLGIEYTVDNIAAPLEAIGCYQWRDDAIRQVFPEYTTGWKNKIVIAGGIDGQINHYNIVVENPEGERFEEMLPLKAYLTIVAATNHKQRIRKTLEYFHADRLNYAVIGTPNRLEYDQGFFVKNGDGSADIKPISHLYKSQVYAMAKHLGLPDPICNSTPTTDTYSLEQGQDEFYFALPYKKMDIAVWCYNHGKSAAELAEKIDITEEQANFVYQDIKAKRKTTRYLHLEPQMIEKVEL
ncbi:NAD(+) synthase [Aliikangiella sp. G2MR2-5]|uniref:NAD(+) synthase n=1 Tax=Aliikangiella sp. G2MR2-5 TaxID=2788943 RepID=UPI001FEDC889|nr:NAD(+) synthase [Aliikangiella sp. G2MR2-5]